MLFYILGAAGIITAVFLAVFYMIPSEEEVMEFQNLLPKGHLENKKAKIFAENGFIKFTYPAVLVFACKLKKSGFLKKKIEGLKVNIESAGYPFGFSEYEYAGYTIVTAVLIMMFAAFFNYSLTSTISAMTLFVGLIIGCVFPVFVLSAQSDNRKLMIYKDLPYKLDLLTMAVEAGLDFFSATKRMVEKDSTGSPIIEEFFQFIQEVRMGMTKGASLKKMADRTNVEALNSIVAAITQAEMMGTPIGRVLKVQAESLRISRTQKAEKAAGEAAVKIIFPLIFILFATILILFGGIIVRWTKGELF